MTGGQLQSVIHRLRRIVGPVGNGALADSELLRRWLAGRDEAAFEVLLWRHGPMVLGLCRRLLRHAQDVEDAFQATFLALVRHAASVRDRDALGSWLYRVAYRVAVQARAASARRKTCAPEAFDELPGAPGEDPAGRELCLVLDEEVNRLPEHYRAPLVLCYFEGRTNEEAARELGRPVGTILSRLARAREQLRRRLAARGLALPTGLPVVLARPSIQAVPARLVTTAIRTATLAAAGPAIPDSIPEHIAIAAERALRAMSMTQTKFRTAVLLALVLVGGGGLLAPAPAGNGGEFVEQAAIVSAPPAPAAPVILHWNFKVGKTIYQEMTTVTTQTMTVMGMDIKQTQKQTFYLSWTPLEQKGANWVIEQKIEGVKIDVEIGGNKTTFDSTRGVDAASPLSDFFKALVGARFKLTVSPRMQVLAVEGRQELLGKLIKANPQCEPLLRQILTEKALGQLADFALIKVGDEGPAPVRKGDTWTRTTEQDMGAIGTYTSTSRYTYEGKDGQLHRIQVKSKLAYTAPVKNAPGDLPFKIDSADLKSNEGTGTIWFDNDRGRLDRSEMNLKLEGTLRIMIGGVATEVKLSQVQKTTVRFTDENPVRAKK